MGWLEDAYRASGMGHTLTVLASANMGYTGQGTSINFSMRASPGTKVTITTGVESGVSANVSVTGNNIPLIDITPVEDTNIVIIEVPPAASQVEILFSFNGIGFDPESGPMGSLTFTDIELESPTIQGDLLKFSVNDGVRILNHQYASYDYGDGAGGDIFNEPTALNVENYPIYGETESILSADSGVITKKGKLNLGTN